MISSRGFAGVDDDDVFFVAETTGGLGRGRGNLSGLSFPEEP
jgi:hypothetical protein